MRAKLAPNEKFIEISDISQMDRNNLVIYFTRKVNNWYIIKQKNQFATVESAFINDYNMIPVGLWQELINFSKEYKTSLEFTDGFYNKIKDQSVSKVAIYNFAETLFKESVIEPRDYQKEAVYKILTNKNCCVEMSTSSGKTLMSYILFKYMIDVLKLKHILYITPNTTLTTQTSEKFILYEEQNKIERTWKYNEIYSGSKNVSSEIPEIVFGNYQSLCKKKREYLEQFDCVIEDECHHSRSSTNKAIISKCINAKYKIGMTGTFPKDGSYDSFILQSYIGPVVYRLSQYRLINDENSATPIYVIGMLLDYLDVEDKDKFYNLRKNKERGDVKTSGKIYNTEKDIARQSYKRFKYICDTIKKTTKNSLVLFTDVQNEYGKRIYNSIKEYSDKNVYYVDGSTKGTLRDYAISQMENDLDGNTIIVASVKCFSEGVDICNLFNIFLVETTKSDNTIAQILGRGMRKFEGKERTLLFDFGDNFKYCRNNDIHHSKNYLLRHYNERAAIYRERGFPYQSYDIKID